MNTETCKSSNKKARCDIWIKLTSNYNRCAECAIELKCFRKSEGETITDNRFSILKDLENLEHYQSQNKKLICYEVVYTNNPNYTNKNSHSYLAIGNECECTGSITSNSKTVELQNNYTFSWDAFGNKKDGHYFLKTKVKK